MRRSALLAVVALMAAVSACGDPDDFGTDTMPDWEPPLTQEPMATPPGPPATLAPVTADLEDPSTWIGHHVRESTVAAPFTTITLDDTATGWISAMTGCGMPSDITPPSVCPMFVRADPGGYGHSGFEPGVWVLLAWVVGDEGYPGGGIVYDALAFRTTEPDMMPIGQCRAADGSDGVFAGLLAYDASFLPTGDPQHDNAAHPLVRAWTIDSAYRLVEVPTADVRCELYSYGD